MTSIYEPDVDAIYRVYCSWRQLLILCFVRSIGEVTFYTSWLVFKRLSINTVLEFSILYEMNIDRSCRLSAGYMTFFILPFIGREHAALPVNYTSCVLTVLAWWMLVCLCACLWVIVVSYGVAVTALAATPFRTRQSNNNNSLRKCPSLTYVYSFTVTRLRLNNMSDSREHIDNKRQQIPKAQSNVTYASSLWEPS